jgi:L-amino acid N-acyltransferase YncA/DNA-binding transcriptional ArsR family regulator
MSILGDMTATTPATSLLPEHEAATYAEWFASLAEPTRVRLLHIVATTPGGITVGQLTELLGISQSTC